MSLTNEKKIIIKQAIEALLDKGMKDKSEIYSKIVEEFGIQRIDARRLVRDLRNEMMNKVKILQNEVMITGRGNKVG